MRNAFANNITDVFIHVIIPTTIIVGIIIITIIIVINTIIISIIVITRHRSHRVGSRFLPFVVAQPLVDTVGIDGMQHRRTRSWERDEVPEPAGSSGSGRHCDWESDHGLSEDSSAEEAADRTKPQEFIDFMVDLLLARCDVCKPMGLMCAFWKTTLDYGIGLVSCTAYEADVNVFLVFRGMHTICLQSSLVDLRS